MRFKPVPLLVLLPHLQLVNSLILHICGSWILSGYFSVWIFITPLPKNYHSSSLHIHYTTLYRTLAPNYVVLMLPTPGKLKSSMLWLAHHWLIFLPCCINFLKSSTSAWSFLLFSSNTHFSYSIRSNKASLSLLYSLRYFSSLFLASIASLFS